MNHFIGNSPLEDIILIENSFHRKLRINKL